jgi:hypothetical protein
MLDLMLLCCLSPALSVGRSLAATTSIFPLSSGYNPSDQLRIKATPEVEVEEATQLARFLQSDDRHRRDNTD